jgi:DNA-binding response OmpR family regulator
MRILLVEDDALVAAGLREGLGRQCFVVDHLGAA